jgi:hypothetical protein
MRVEHRIRSYDQSIRTLSYHRRKGAVEFGGTSRLDDLKLNLQRPGSLSKLRREVLIVGVLKEGQAGNRWDDLLEKLHLFAADLLGQAGKPCNIPTRLREAADEPVCNRIANRHHDDGDRLGGSPRHVELDWGRRNDDIDLETNQLGCKGGESLALFLCQSVLDADVLTFDVAELLQALTEGPE